MAISRYREPSLFGLQRLNRILDEAFSGLPFSEQGNVITSTWFAPTDVSESENTLRISMELPGVDPSDVRLSLENNVLTIRGEKKQQSEENNERVHRFERTYGMFERTFALPNTVDPDQIEARYENGVLLVTIPRAERAKPREIRVSTSASGSTQVRTGAQSQRGTSGTSQRAEGGNGSRDAEEEGSAAKSRR
ncbi:MAG TPA: Hsp20/alpha crystallin family protein [Gemmatimonadales bacterium]|nr:Hsp20/alpha crystallin family protein [Gemmatimonadales bacterium]